MQRGNHFLPTDAAERQAQLGREQRAIARAQKGDLSGMEPVLASFAEPLFTAILGRVGDRSQAEDLLKDTFVTALDRIAGYSHTDQTLYFWLRQIALHKVVDHHRSLGQRKHLCQLLLTEANETVETTPTHTPSVEEEIGIAKRRIEATLLPLEPRCLTALRLRLCEEKPRTVCASNMSVSVETFDVLLLRAVHTMSVENPIRTGQISFEPDAPIGPDEANAAKSLREALVSTEQDAETATAQVQTPRSNTSQWLAAHFRFPGPLDSLGEVRARGLARAAKDTVLAKRSHTSKTTEPLRPFRRWNRLTRLLSAVGLLVVAWFAVEQGRKLRQASDTQAQTQLAHPPQTAWFLRDSLARRESPTARLDWQIRQLLHKRGLRHSTATDKLFNRHHRLTAPNTHQVVTP